MMAATRMRGYTDAAFVMDGMRRRFLRPRKLAVPRGVSSGKKTLRVDLLDWTDSCRILDTRTLLLAGATCDAPRVAIFLHMDFKT